MDTIAKAIGIAPDSPERIKAGLAYTLSEAADDGHCYLPVPNLVADAAKILDVRAELITPCLDELAAAEGVVREAVPAPAQAAPPVPAVYLPSFYQAERSLAAALLRLHVTQADRLPGFTTVDWDKALTWLRSRTGAQLAPELADAVRLALTSKVAVLTGGPGCGSRSRCGRWWNWPQPRGQDRAGRADQPGGQANLLLQEGLTPFREGAPERRSRRALAAAVRTKGAGRRHTALAHRLQVA